MKRLSLLLLLSISCQSAFGLNLSVWNVMLNNLHQAVNAQTTDTIDLLARITSVEDAVKAIPAQGQAANLEFVYNEIIGVWSGPTWADLTPEAKADSQAMILGFLAQLKAEVKAGKVTAKGLNTVDTIAEMLKSAKNKALHGASVAVNFANEHRKATFGTVVGTAATVAAYRNRAALKTAWDLARENAPKAGSALRSAGSWIAEKASQAASSIKSNTASVRELGLQGVGRGIQWKAAAVANTASEFVAAHPVAVKRTALGSVATVASTMAAVKSYNKLMAMLAAKKAAKLAVSAAQEYAPDAAQEESLKTSSASQMNSRSAVR